MSYSDAKHEQKCSEVKSKIISTFISLFIYMRLKFFTENVMT